MSLGEVLSDFLFRQINRSRRDRDAVYLDTNAWSALAKGQISFEPLIHWVKEKGFYIWMTRFSMAELAGDTRLFRPFAELLQNFPFVLLDYGENEIQGAPWYQVQIAYQQLFQVDQDMVDGIVDEYTNGPMRDARMKVLEDGRTFGAMIQKQVSEIPKERPRDWNGFTEVMEKQLRTRCEANGIPVNEASIHDLECFIGQRLSHSVVYWRYFLSGQKWRPSDYIDYLHTMDMAYARVVITERNLAECIQQVSRKTRIMTPDAFPYVEFLQDPFAWEVKPKKSN
jgi:hypothetical protein